MYQYGIIYLVLHIYKYIYQVFQNIINSFIIFCDNRLTKDLGLNYPESRDLGFATVCALCSLIAAIPWKPNIIHTVIE
jgi:hypothetical protein